MRTYVITGASDGIGKAAVERLRTAHPDARILAVGRSAAKTKAVAEQFDCEPLTCDFVSLDQVRALAEQILETTDSIDALANNAGGIFDGPDMTEDGYEKTWQVNVVAPFLLTNLLLEPLRKSRATVVATSSLAALIMAKFDPMDVQSLKKFDTSRAYGNAKLGDALVSAELARRVPEINPVSFHPGVLASNFSSGTNWGFSKFYNLTRKIGVLQPSSGGNRLAHFADGTPGVHFERGAFYLTPNRPVRIPHADAAAGVVSTLNAELNLQW
ncbi:SDR family NAD(P)-dependent oxidoreductase [Corynebacterium tapiri]|uniref:SDR family NAD(P)-dependent oxidoreductase n=1 Tax=Corynebacterium tapiri TaxID=1448266 RepID=A0A5C4U7V9_9CORY|nr:SDR family NAD(P)-dependent oxidoreductase [Corynebacterium tapiri]TNM00461.1 SDR family NAD(P)-dependent oxidoreductase [Corynebacterium tapiri]